MPNNMSGADKILNKLQNIQKNQSKNKHQKDSANNNFKQVLKNIDSQVGKMTSETKGTEDAAKKMHQASQALDEMEKLKDTLAAYKKLNKFNS